MKTTSNFCLALALVFLFGCKSENKNNPDQISNESTAIEQTSSINERGQNENWVQLLNAENEQLKDLYTDNAIKIISADQILDGNASIAEYHINKAQPIQRIWADAIADANVEKGIEYEVGGYFTKDNEKYNHVIIWENDNGKRKRSFEFIVKNEKTSYDLSEISERRDEWIILCNKHNAADLINEMYSENTLYFNHKPIVKGRTDLIKEYSYMNNEKYTLTLTPITVQNVSEEYVFELGQCKGSYNGKYIIVWKKSDEGKWEVFIDSNI